MWKHDFMVWPFGDHLVVYCFNFFKSVQQNWEVEGEGFWMFVFFIMKLFKYLP